MKWKNIVYSNQNGMKMFPCDKSMKLLCCMQDWLGPYGAVMDCWGQDHKSAGRDRRIIFSFLSQAKQEAPAHSPKCRNFLLTISAMDTIFNATKANLESDWLEGERRKKARVWRQDLQVSLGRMCCSFLGLV